MHRYLKSEIGSNYKLQTTNYKLQISKIKNRDIENTTVTIYFIDALNTEKNETLTKIDAKGIIILEKLK